MKQSFLIAVLVCALTGLAACKDSNSDRTISPNPRPGTPPAQTPAVLPPPTYEKTVSQELAIPMSDGVRLGATVTFPSLGGSTPAPGKFPVVVSITPYSRNGLGGAPDRSVFAARGIIGVTVDTRGTGGRRKRALWPRRLWLRPR